MTSDDEIKPAPSFHGALAQFRHSARSPVAVKTITRKSASAFTKTKVIHAASVSKPAPKPKQPPAAATDLLQAIPPLLRPGLLCVFIGFNPGIESARTGHHYAHASNQFWPLLSASGCVDEPCTASEDGTLMDRYGYGFHDLVVRPTKGIADLSQRELSENVPRLGALLGQVRPVIVCFVGKGIYERIYKVTTGHAIPKGSFEWGEQEPLPGFADGASRLFVMPSTSGLAAGVKRSDKLKLFQDLAAAIAEERKSWTNQT